MRIRSSLTTPSVAIDRNIDNTTMDLLSSVNAHIDEIAVIGTEEVLANIATTAALDFESVLAGVDTVNNLTVVVVETLPAGSQASAELVGSVIELRIPAGANGIDGVDGEDGVNGLTPDIRFTYNSTTGDIDYDTLSWTDMSGVITTTVNEV